MSIKLLIVTTSLVILSFICYNVFAVEPEPASLSDGNMTGQPPPEPGPGYDDQCKAQPPLGMRIAPDKGEYQPGQRITLFVEVLDSAGCNIPVLVKVNLVKIDQDVSLKDSQYYYAYQYGYPYIAIIQDTGKYVINVSLVSTSLNQGKSLEASTIINSVNFYETTSAKIVLVAIGSFAGLMVVTGLSNKQSNKHKHQDDKHQDDKHQDGFEILRFVFISGIIFSVIGSFVFLVDEVGTNSPVGLIRTNPSNDYGPLNGGWVINIGGDIRGPFTQEQNGFVGDIRGPFTQEQKAIGIQIPLYVVIFGIIGGYLRYLYSKALPILTNIKTSKKYEDNPNVKKETLHSFYLSLGEIALLFLAPVLAVATYFILTIFGMSGPNSEYTIGALSIAIGLVTKEVIDVIIKFAKSKLGQAEDEIKNTKDKQDIPDETTTPDTETKPDETTTPDTETKPDETTTPDTETKPDETTV